MIAELYERMTGKPWTTSRSAAEEFGPTPATEFPELSRYTDAELYERGPEIVAELRAARRERTSELVGA